MEKKKKKRKGFERRKRQKELLKGVDCNEETKGF